MLRILDARTGEPVPAAPARRGLTRVQAHARRLDPTALRVLLTADLLVRALELGGTPVWTILTSPRDHPELRTAATRLAIRPFEDARDLASGLGESQAVHVAERGSESALGEGPVVRVEAVTADPARPAPLPALLSDPSALRLALLAVARDRPVRLDPAVLEDAARRLARWRRAVAGWARRPSRPVPGEVRERLRAAWEDDLDLPAVLGVLGDVESAAGVPDGARFETFVYADRLLALDLARDVGGPV
ncbi:hypothetical protein [Streptomyces capoamus]|uniref:hypothetical protein n=1 Tax=Streptomyces capoamus TaxID=68183 RepID=UPI00339862C5